MAASAEGRRGHQALDQQQQRHAATVQPCLATMTLDDLHLTYMSPTDTQQTRLFCSATDFQQKPEALQQTTTALYQPVSRLLTVYRTVNNSQAATQCSRFSYPAGRAHSRTLLDFNHPMC